jgi:hypothetical protein
MRLHSVPAQCISNIEIYFPKIHFISQKPREYFMSMYKVPYYVSLIGCCDEEFYPKIGCTIKCKQTDDQTYLVKVIELRLPYLLV